MLKKIGLVITSVLFTLLMLEVALCVYLIGSGTQDQKILYLFNRQQIESIGERFEGAAYLNFMLSPVREEHNSTGDDESIPFSALYRFVLVRLGWNPPVSFKIETQFVRPMVIRIVGWNIEMKSPTVAIII